MQVLKESFNIHGNVYLELCVVYTWEFHINSFIVCYFMCYNKQFLVIWLYFYSIISWFVLWNSWSQYCSNQSYFLCPITYQMLNKTLVRALYYVQVIMINHWIISHFLFFCGDQLKSPNFSCFVCLFVLLRMLFCGDQLKSPSN